MALWSYFHSRLMIHVKGCASPLANQALRDSAIDFFEQSFAWRAWLPEITVVDAQRDYAMVPATGSRVIRLDKATRNGRDFEIDGFNWAESDPSLYEQESAGVTSEDRVNITLLRNCTAGDKIQIKAALAPTRDATGIPDHLAAKYEDAILAGARYRLRMLPDLAFSNAQLGVLDLTEFNGRVDRATNDAWRSGTRKTPRARVSWC
jgi:hypothetical protein